MTTRNRRQASANSMTRPKAVRRTGEKVGGFYVYEHTTADGRVFRWYRVEACDGAGVGVDVEWFVWPVVDGVDLDGEYLDANPLDRHYQPQPWFIDNRWSDVAE